MYLCVHLQTPPSPIHVVIEIQWFYMCHTDLHVSSYYWCIHSRWWKNSPIALTVNYTQFRIPCNTYYTLLQIRILIVLNKSSSIEFQCLKPTLITDGRFTRKPYGKSTLNSHTLLYSVSNIKTILTLELIRACNVWQL